jgi:histidine triad (HIT) family protein
MISVKECIFCKIVKGEIPKEFRYKDDLIVAFDDIRPQAETHVLFVPKEHYGNFEQLTSDKVLASIRNGIQQLVKETKLAGRGYKIQVFGGGAQTVDHLHFHLIGPVGLKV